MVSFILHKRADWCNAKVGTKFESWPRCQLSLLNTPHLPWCYDMYSSYSVVRLRYLDLWAAQMLKYFYISDKIPCMFFQPEVRPLSLYHTTWQGKNIRRISHASFTGKFWDFTWLLPTATTLLIFRNSSIKKTSHEIPVSLTFQFQETLDVTE